MCAWSVLAHSHERGLGLPSLLLQIQLSILDGQNRAIVVAESIARVIAAIRITGIRLLSYLFPKHRHSIWSLETLRSLRCAVESRDWRACVQHSFHMELRKGLRELTAFTEHLRLAIGNFARLSCQCSLGCLVIISLGQWGFQ